MTGKKVKKLSVTKDKASKLSLVSDVSLHADYSGFQLHYDTVCRQRYQAAWKRYDQQFLYELQKLEEYQRSAYDAMRFHRHFVYTVLWPPLHTRKEIGMVLEKMFKLSPQQTKRLRELMTEVIC